MSTEYDPIADRRESSDLHATVRTMHAKVRKVFEAWNDGRCTGDEALDEIIAVLSRELGNAPTYTAPLTIPVKAIAEAYSHGDRGWQILDAKDEQTWRELTDVVDCELGGRCPNAGDCNVLVSTAWSAGFDHRDGESSLTVRIPAVTA